MNTAEQEELDPEVIYGEDYVDVTGTVQCYENGKTFSCDCGQGIGTDLDKKALDCASCGRTCVDKNADEREPPQRDNGQSALTDWG